MKTNKKNLTLFWLLLFLPSLFWAQDKIEFTAETINNEEIVFSEI